MVDMEAGGEVSSSRSDGPSATGLSASEAEGPVTRWVRFTCQARVYGVPLERVREIMTPQPMTRLPGCDATVAGLVGVRGRVVTALDLGRILGSRASASLPDHRLLLVESGERIVALVVDDASAVVDGILRPPVPEPERLHGLDVEDPHEQGRVESGEGMFPALDLDRVVGRHFG